MYSLTYKTNRSYQYFQIDYIIEPKQTQTSFPCTHYEHGIKIEPIIAHAFQSNRITKPQIYVFIDI